MCFTVVRTYPFEALNLASILYFIILDSVMHIILLFQSHINLELKSDCRHVLVRGPHLTGKEAEAQRGHMS